MFTCKRLKTLSSEKIEKKMYYSNCTSQNINFGVNFRVLTIPIMGHKNLDTMSSKIGTLNSGILNVQSNLPNLFQEEATNSLKLGKKPSCAFALDGATSCHTSLISIQICV